MKDLEVEGLAAKATQQPENDRQVSKQELSISNNISSISCLGQDGGCRTVLCSTIGSSAEVYTAGLLPRVGVAPYDYHERVARAEDVIRACPHFRN
jgi:hypothetical protein